jgi:hypothetical protein
MLRSVAVPVALLLGAATPVAALTIDFEDFAHGDVVAAPLASHPGYTIVAENSNRSFDAAIAFDTGESGTADGDLERGSGFATGNIAGSELGNILILQENDDCSATSCSRPDDEGGRPAGKFTILLDAGTATEGFSFDLIDVDDATSEAGRITFFLLAPGQVDVEVASYSFADFLSFGQGVQFGDNSANRIQFDDLGAFNAFEIVMGGSGGVDNLVADGVPVPEPTAAALLGLGLVALATAASRHR